jgi:dihydrofolate reductase
MRIFLIAAMTADGLIGRDSQHLADWSSREDKKVFVRLTKEAGTLVFGSKTYETIGHGLPGRRMIVMTSDPSRYEPSEGVEFVSESPEQLVKRLANDGVTSLAIGGGARTYQEFMDAGLIDELYLTLEPVLFGQGVSLFSSQLNTQLKLIETTPLNDDVILLHYQVVH